MKKLLILAFFIITSAVAFGPKTIVPIRSQGVNYARELCGWEQRTHLYNECEQNYGTISFAIEYGRTFSASKMANMLFGGECISISGSSSFDRNQTDVLADYFGLPRDYKSVMRVAPLISNAVFDLDWYMAFDEWVQGLYLSLHVPIACTAWALNPSETVINPGSAIDPAGYMGSEKIARSGLPATILSAWQGLTTFGDMQEPLEYGLILERETMSRVTEIQLSVGWDFLQDPEYHLGAFVRGAVPTGNYRKARYLFEPVVGNDHHATVGGGFTGHWIFWQDQEYDQSLGIYGVAVVEHLFNVKEKRSYNFINGLGSRFMLLQEIQPQQEQDPAQQLFFGVEQADFQYTGRLIPAINQTTFDSIIKVSLQSDIAIELTYTCGKWLCDIGYEFWGRSAEQLVCRDRFPLNQFVLKGDAQMYGFDQITELPVALSTSQHESTIYGGQTTGNSTFVNANADNFSPAFTSGGADVLNNLTAADAAVLFIPIAQVNSSNPPLFLSDADIDDNSALVAKAISHKIFIYLGGVFHACDDPWFKEHTIDIYAGVGASVEWACHCFKENSALSEWAAWARVGVSF